MINMTDSNLPRTGVLPSNRPESDTLKLSFLTKLDELLSSPPDDVGLGYLRLNLTDKAARLSQIVSQYVKKGIEFDQVFHDYDFDKDNEGVLLVTEISRILQITCNLRDKTLIPKLFLTVAERLDCNQESETLITMMRALIAVEKQYLETPRVQVEVQPTALEILPNEQQFADKADLPWVQSYLLVSLGLVNTTLGITCGLEPGYLACVLGFHIPLLAAIVAASAGMAMMGYGLYLSVFLNPEAQHASDDSLSQELDGEESFAFDQLFGCYGAK